MPSFVDIRALRRSGALFLLASAVAGVLGDCAPGTQLVDMWRDPTALSQPIRKMLVVTFRRDPASRRIWEDGFVTQLEKRGVTATPSYDLFQQGVPDTVDIE